MKTRNLTEDIYSFITTDNDGRPCDDLPDEACSDVPRNFVLNVLNGSCTKLAEQVASSELVLPWLLEAIGASAVFTGFLVPVHKAGSLMPQMAVSGRIRAYRKRKWFWVGAGAFQAVMLAVLVLASLLLPANWAGLFVVLALGLFGIGSGVGSVAFKDVMAKTIPKGRRGRLLATRSMAGGALTLLAGVIIKLYVSDHSPVSTYAALLIIASILWLAGVVFFAMITEQEGATASRRDTLQEARAGLKLLRQNQAFRRFLASRALFLSISLSIPFYAVLARQQTGSGASNLGIFMIAASIAKVLSSPFWGKFADSSSRHVMIAGGLMAVGVGILAVGFTWMPAAWQSPYLYALLFLLIGMARSGVRLGRKTYLVDGAPEKDRPLYVSLSNTVIGGFMLAGGLLGIIAEQYGPAVLIGVFAGLSLMGVISSWVMPEAEGLARH